MAHAAAKETLVNLAGHWLRVARLGTVCVHPERRRSGLGRDLVAAAADLVERPAAVILNPAREDYVIRFYEALGFVAAVRTKALWTIAAERVSAPKSAVTVRPAAEGDVGALDALYRRHYISQPGSLSRTADWWRRRVRQEKLLWSVPTPRFQVAEHRGHVVAYLADGPDDGFRVWEWAARPGADDEALALLHQAAAGARSRVALRIAAADPLWPLLAGFDPRDETTERVPVMLRAGDLATLEPVLAAVVEDHGGRLGRQGELARVEAGGVVLTASWSHLLALAYDGRKLGEWLDAGQVSLTPEGAVARAAVAAVLPPREAGRRPTDAY